MFVTPSLYPSNTFKLKSDIRSSQTSATKSFVVGVVMSKSNSVSLAFGILAFAILPAAAEQMESPQQVFTPKGIATHVGEFYSIFPDCTLAPQDDFRVAMAPKHGKITKVHSKGHGPIHAA